MLCLKLPNQIYPHVISVGCFSMHFSSAFHCIPLPCLQQLGMLRNAGAAPRSTHCIWVGAMKSCLVHTELLVLIPSSIFGYLWNRGYYRRLEQAPPVIHPVARLVDSCCWSFATSPCVVWCNEKTVALTRRGGHGVNPVFPTASNPSTSAWQCRLQFSEALLPSRCCSQLLRDVNFHRWNAWCPHISAIPRPCPFRNVSNIEFVCLLRSVSSPFARLLHDVRMTKPA